MPHFFISYSHLDATYVRRLARALEQEGYSPWVDDRIDYGSTWDEEVEKRLDGCAAFILVMTPNSSTSRWVKNELNRAMRKNKPIFPLLLEGEEPWLAVESIQFLDVRGGKLPDERFYQHLSRYATREKPVREAEPSPGTEPSQDKIQPEVAVEKAIIEEYHPSQPEGIVGKEISQVEILVGKEAPAELIPIDQLVEEELPAQPIQDKQVIEETPPPAKIPIPITPHDLVAETKTEVRQGPAQRIKKEKQKEIKPARIRKTRRTSAEQRKWVTGVIGGAILLGLSGVAGTLWAFREPLGLTKETPGFGQSTTMARTQSSTVSLPTQTAIPLPGISITIENAGKVTELRRWGDGGVINQVVINSSGTRLAVGTSQGVYLFDPTTLEQLDYLAYESDITALVFTKEGSLLAMGLGDHSIEVKRTEGLHGRVIHSFTSTAMINSLAFDPWGKYLAVGLEDGTIQVWSMEDGSLLNTLEGHEDIVTTVVFLEDTLLASASLDGTIRFWKIPEGIPEEPLAAQPEGVTSLGFYLGAPILTAGGADGSIQVWSVAERIKLYLLDGHTSKIFNLAMSPAGKNLASTAEDGLRVWSLGEDKGEMLDMLEGHSGPAESLVFAPDGITLFSGGTTDGTVRGWHIDSYVEGGILDQFSTPVLFSALSMDGSQLAEVIGGGAKQLWKIAEGTKSQISELFYETFFVGFSQDGKYIGGVSPSSIEEITIADNSLIVGKWETIERVTTAAFNPAFDKVAVGFTDGVIRIYDFRGNLLETWGTAQSGKEVRLLEYCPTGAYLAASHDDGSLVIWKETGGDPKVEFSFQEAGSIRSLAYGLNCNKLLLAGEDNRLHYFPDDAGDMADLSLPEKVSSLGLMEFSPDGTILAIATNEYEIALLDFEKMELLNVLKGHTKDITSLTFVPDNIGPLFNFDKDASLLVSTSLDGTTRLWGVEE